jgi:hypothetical protein
MRTSHWPYGRSDGPGDVQGAHQRAKLAAVTNLTTGASDNTNSGWLLEQIQVDFTHSLHA